MYYQIEKQNTYMYVYVRFTFTRNFDVEVSSMSFFLDG